MKLQLTIDQIELDEALKIVEDLRKTVDIFEIVTPLIIKEGLNAVRIIRKSFPEISLLADVKIVDGGSYESKMTFEAGADLVTVLGLAHDMTISAAVEKAEKYRKAVMVDLLGVADIPRRPAGVERQGAKYICVHTASDLKDTSKDTLRGLKEATAAVKTAKVAVAGGIALETIEEVIKHKPEIVIVGGGIMKQSNRRDTAHLIKELLNKAAGG